MSGSGGKAPPGLYFLTPKEDKMDQKQTNQTAGNIPFFDETAHLADICEKLAFALRDANASVDRFDKEYSETKRYMVQNRGEIDPHEMFQNELILRRIDSSGAFSVGVLDQLSKLRQSPYFARIDFCEKGGETEKYYIGRFSFSHNDELLIVDWRAPVAGMFYDYGIGAAGYDAPHGRIDGELQRKRQFKIADGKLEYVLETSDHIQDDVLQRELSHTSDEKMKSIISTIQKEQNSIIRNENAGTLMIQGVAGSGKTSIALHRIAFLLYRFKDRLCAQNITILSPNKVFSDYISGVLPELGEEPIFEAGFEDVAHIQLEGVIDFETGKAPLEVQEEALSERIRFKSTLDFVKQMDEYIGSLSDFAFTETDCTFGSLLVPAVWIRARLNAYAEYPLKERLFMIADDIRECFETENPRGEEAPGRGTIQKSLNAMLKYKNTLALYKDFYRKTDASKMLVMPGRKTLEYHDVFPFLYLKAAFEGLRESRIIKHLVIDEMQDYTPIQHAVINRLFPCAKTILGDFGQRIDPNSLHTLQDIRQIYEGAEFITLNKSYRSTCEIIDFAKKICPVELDVVERHGTAPRVIPCSTKQEELEELRRLIRSFPERGGRTMGIIVKTDEDAKKLFDSLREEFDIHLIEPLSAGFQGGISVVSVQMCKGLEFDEVLLPGVDRQSYHTEHDRNLLYIACTRAMHTLTLLYSGKGSALI